MGSTGKGCNHPYLATPQPLAPHPSLWVPGFWDTSCLRCRGWRPGRGGLGRGALMGEAISKQAELGTQR